jgi:hypothetical protein
VSEKEVPQFFDDLLADVGTSKALAKKERHHTRRTVIASLVPTAAFQNIDDPSAQVARLYFESPSPLPKQGPIPEGLLSTDDIRERTGEEFIDAIRDYTALHDFMYIRRVESLDQTSLKKLGMSEKEISLWRSKSDLIHTGIKKLPIIETPVYRGLVGLNEETIGLWYSAWKARKAIGLGFDNQGALSSASWQVKGATEFIMPNLMPGGTTSKYAVLLEIRSHRGVSIEHISEIPDEFEVLLPRDQKVIIEHMSFVSGARKTILIKMRGVDSASVSIRERKLRVA